MKTTTPKANTQAQEKENILTNLPIAGHQLRRPTKPLDCSRPILTEQHQKQMTDINVIMENYVKTGMLPNYSGSPLLYVDDTNKISFEETHDIISFARHRFDLLPTKLKNELNNDYRKLETWLSDPDNTDRAIKMGLLTKRETPPQPKGEKTPVKQETSKQESATNPV